MSCAPVFHQVPSYHLVLEAFLLGWVIWLLIRRVSSREKKLKAERLSKEEEEELLREWKPEPLVPDVDPDHPALHVPVIDEKVGGDEGKDFNHYQPSCFLSFFLFFLPAAR